MPLPASAFPLRTSGASILGADGRAVTLAGVNWGGGQQDEGVPYGLDKLPREDIIARIAGMGLNHVRLPFSVGSFLTSKGNPVTTPAPAGRLSANPDLQGLSPWEIFQVLVTDCTAAGLYVILNQHLLYPGWCCASEDNNGFWYNDNWGALTFLACWRMIAARFAGNPLVGYDLHNEPRKATIGGSVRTPTWGDGNGLTDFRLAYRNTIDVIRGLDPDCLCFCEGLSYAADLTGWKNAPVGRQNTVASLHDYSWFHDPLPSQAGYDAAMDARGGYLVTSGTCPLWIGEFGANSDASDAGLSSGWLPLFISWAARRHVHWCWWELGATAVLGTQPVTNKVKMKPGQREAFSLIGGYDWLGTQVNVLNALAPVMPGDAG